MYIKKIAVKGIVIGLIFLFIGGSIVPNISGIVAYAINVSFINSEDFDTKIENLMKLGHFPGLVVCIVRNDTLLFSDGYGYADIRPLHKRETTNDTVFPMGSISKSIAATAIMQLNETGLIGLDDNVSEYLPFDLKNPKYPDVNITPRMLLAHQSSIKIMGLLYHYIALDKFVKDPLKWLERYFKRPTSWCDYAPGKNVKYATTDINILGYVVENITDQTYSDYCQENIFKPLKMYNTSFFLSDFNKNQMARQYVWFKGLYLPIRFIEISELMFPGGGLRSSIGDMSHFLIMHTSGGVYDGVRILSEKSVEEMHKTQYPESYDGKCLHGLGWYQHTEDNVTYGGHSGTHIGAYAVMEMKYACNYSDQVGVMFFYNQHPYIRTHFMGVPPKEEEAKKEIKKALYEKVDEL